MLILYTRPKTQYFSSSFTYVDLKRNTVLERYYNFPSNVTLEEDREKVLRTAKRSRFTS